MRQTEETISFACADETLIGVLARPERANTIGIVIVVGGPQTRVGSHRQFVLLARALASAGHPTLRFDYRGMGDSTGAQRDFEAVSDDIGAAVDALCTACPSVGKVVLWGLCDGASASLLYLDETHDPRIAGLCLLNPWARSEATLARTQVKHYYGQRLLQREFWFKLSSGRIDVFRAVGEAIRKIGQARSKPKANRLASFQDRMARAWRNFQKPVLLLLSGDDFTAKEFFEYAAAADGWRGLLDRPNLKRIEIAGADHTFSTQEWRETVQNACLDWLERYD